MTRICAGRDSPRLRQRRGGPALGDRPITFAHRGARAYAAENTIAAFRLGLAQGATGLETDAWLSSDGLPVLVHDGTIRSADRRIRVTRQRADRLAEVGVPTLADLYRRCGTDFELSIDVEHAAVAEPLVVVAEAFGADQRLWLCSGDLAILEALRRRTSVVGLVCSTGPRRLGGLPALVPRLLDLGIDVVNLHWEDWTPARISLVHDAGLLGFGWDAQGEVAIDRLMSLGIDGLYCDRPDVLLRRIEERWANHVG